MNGVLAHQQWKVKLVAGVLAAILGGVALAWPGPSILFAASMFGVYLLVSGLAGVFLVFTLSRSAAARVLLVHRRRASTWRAPWHRARSTMIG